MTCIRASALLFAALSLFPLAHAHDAKSGHTEKQLQVDIERHQAMAEAHQAAAQCLASGKEHSVCQKELLQACKGLAIGKYCGMRHSH